MGEGGRRASPIIFAGPAKQGRRSRRPDDVFHRALEKFPVFNYVERVPASGTRGPVFTEKPKINEARNNRGDSSLPAVVIYIYIQIGGR